MSRQLSEVEQTISLATDTGALHEVQVGKVYGPGAMARYAICRSCPYMKVLLFTDGVKAAREHLAKKHQAIRDVHSPGT